MHRGVTSDSPAGHSAPPPWDEAPSLVMRRIGLVSATTSGAVIAEHMGAVGLQTSLSLTTVTEILGVQFKVCHGSLYAVTWLVDEPREFNLPTLPQRCITYLPEKLPSKYGVHSEEYLSIRTLFSTFCVNVKMQYTLNQRLFLVKQYWITNSITATQRAYQREFGVRNPPKRNTILGLVNKLERTGSLVSEKGKHRSSHGCCRQYRLIFMEFVEQLDDVELSQGYFQQDGATCHTSNESMELIASFFDDRIISRNL
ncbi:hypothetical protein ANN_15060 [Periplaneta americana]|uniref:DUF4817 domain-containing protein n=1 Tax=Periplaneta americana TaxID=6978 RepID=A0ABQ8SYN9_PERAM|nr:hypothetical protein ANN_15060 [Periplaneta americana]